MDDQRHRENQPGQTGTPKPDTDSEPMREPPRQPERKEGQRPNPSERPSHEGERKDIDKNPGGGGGRSPDRHGGTGSR